MRQKRKKKKEKRERNYMQQEQLKELRKYCLSIHPNYILFDDWCLLKNNTDITYGYSNFKKEDVDQLGVYYDQHGKYFDWLRIREVEDKKPHFVLLPKNFWKEHRESISLPIIDELQIQERIHKILEYQTDQSNKLNQRDGYFQTSIKLRKEQLPLIDTIAELRLKNKQTSGIIVAAPGFGKTITSIKILEQIKARGLIIVPNEVLSDQWQEAIINTTEFNQEDIAILEGSDLDKIEKELINKKIAIIKIQSLHSQLKRESIFTLSLLYKDFDCVIYDECHTSGAAEGYAKTTSMFRTPNIIGLSATPYRDAINEYLMKIGIGETIYKSDHKNLIPDVEIHKIWVEFSENEIKKMKSLNHDYIMFLGIFNMFLSNKQQYFDYLADWVVYNRSTGHNIVVLFSTNKMVQNLYNTIKTRHPNYITENKVLTLTGTTKKDSLDLVKMERKRIMLEYRKYKESFDIQVKEKTIKRKEALVLVRQRRKEIDQEIETLTNNSLNLYKNTVKQAETIISNYNLLSAGFDKPELSNIIYGSPRIGKVSVIQSLGRVTRIHEDKKQPLAQFIIPDFFIETHKNTPIILRKNIEIEYQAKFKYVGF